MMNNHHRRKSTKIPTTTTTVIYPQATSINRNTPLENHSKEKYNKNSYHQHHTQFHASITPKSPKPLDEVQAEKILLQAKNIELCQQLRSLQDTYSNLYDKISNSYHSAQPSYVIFSSQHSTVTKVQPSPIKYYQETTKSDMHYTTTNSIVNQVGYVPLSTSTSIYGYSSIIVDTTIVPPSPQLQSHILPKSSPRKYFHYTYCFKKPMKTSQSLLNTQQYIIWFNRTPPISTEKAYMRRWTTIYI